MRLLAVSPVAPALPRDSPRLRASRSGWCILGARTIVGTSGDTEAPEVSDPRTTRPHGVARWLANNGRPPVRPPVCLLTRPRIPFRLRMPVGPYARGSCHYYYHYCSHRHSRRSLTFEGTAALSHKRTASEVAAASLLLIEEPRRWAAEVGGNSKRGVSPELISLRDRN